MILKNALVLNDKFLFKDIDVFIDEGKIKALFKRDSVNKNEVSCYEPGNDFEVDLEGFYLLPGLIDIHIHGSIGHDIMDSSFEAINSISDYLAQNGITSFLATTMSESFQRIENAVLKVKACMDIGTSGAQLLGIHMEGPYFSKQYKGAQNDKFFSLPSVEQFKKLQTISGNNIKIVSIAPEIENALDFIKEISSINSAVVSIGHTGADYDTCIEAIQRGASHATHLFNGMSPLNHRSPGVIGAVLEKELSSELICDGIHIHPCIIKLMYKLLGSSKIVLISDAMRACGLKDGTYELGGNDVLVKSGVARTFDGNIAGSTSTLFQCVKKAIQIGIKPEDAFKMASINPAGVIGLDNFKGSIREGKDADFIITDKNFNLINTIIRGRAVNPL